MGSIVIPAERPPDQVSGGRLQAREPGPMSPCLALISERRDTWIPDRLAWRFAPRVVRDDGPWGQFDAPGRSFLASSSDGSTEAPSTYLKSVMVPRPFLRAILPTNAPMVAWWSRAR